MRSLPGGVVRLLAAIQVDLLPHIGPPRVDPARRLYQDACHQWPGLPWRVKLAVEARLAQEYRR